MAEGPAEEESEKSNSEVNDDEDEEGSGEDADAVLRSIQDVFASWEHTRTASHFSSSSRPSASCSVTSEENTNTLKQVVLDYVTFMDMGVARASAPDQKDKFEILGVKMVQVLELPMLGISASLKMSLKLFHSEIGSLLAKNVELKAKSNQYIQAVAEKESLASEITKSQGALNEISSEVMVEDSLMMTLAAQMKELHARMDDSKARLAAKKRAALQEVEHSNSLIERYAKIEVDERLVTELPAISQEQCEEWEHLKDQMSLSWGQL